MSVAFRTARHAARRLGEDEIPALQALFDANPHYFIVSGGRPAAPDAGAREYVEVPPPSYEWSAHHLFGIHPSGKTHGRLDGIVILYADMPAPTVWHLSLFLIDAALHGEGVAREVHEALEAWVITQPGARWLRLAVVAGNVKGERFWDRMGYTEVKRRQGVVIDQLTQEARILVKPLGPVAWDAEAYFAAAPSDRPADGAAAARVS